MLNKFKNRILFSIIFMLTLTVIIVDIYIKKNLVESYENNRIFIQDRNERIINQLISNYRNTLLKHKNYINHIFEKTNNLKKERILLEKTIDYISKEIEKEFGDSYIYILSDDFKIENNHIQVIYSSNSYQLRENIKIDLLKNISHKNYYQEKVYCINTCSYFIFDKISINNKDYNLFIESKLNNIVNKFKIITNTDLAVIRNNYQTKKAPKLNTKIGKIEYATNFFNTIKIINKIPKNINPNNFLISLDDTRWEANVIPTVFSEISFISLENVENPLKKLNTTKFNSSLILLAFSVLLFVAIYLIIRKPLIKLKLLGSSIHLLGESRFNDLRAILKTKIPRKDMDEIGLIHNIAYDVSFRLEKLEKELRDKATELEKTLGTKTDQYLFLEGLVNYSKVIIIAYGNDHCITMTNDFLFKYFPIEPGHIYNLKITDLLEESYPHITQAINNSRLDKPSTEEVRLSNELGDFWINWMHCRIPSHSEANHHSHLSIGVDITERKKSEQWLEYIAEIDELTGIYNRRTFHKKLDKWLSTAKTEQVRASLLFLDLDKFKQINDRLGHDRGDNFLRKVAEVLKSFENENTITGRLGGDEFALFLYKQEISKGREVAEAIIQRVNKIQQQEFNIGIHASVSIGIAHYPENGQSVAELMSTADLAMYRAKHLINDKVCLYTSETNQDPLTKLDKRNYLNNIIKEDLIELYLQPINHLHSDEVYSYECLSRLKEINGRINKPMTIFKYGEECGLSSELDIYILHKIFSKYKELISIIPKEDFIPKFSINVSAKSIVQSGFANSIIHSCRDQGIDCKNIIIEITETGEILDIKEAVFFMNKLKSFGITVALDDFGDGFATLRYLRNFPFDLVKIDGQFVIDIDKNEKDQIIVDSLVNSAKRFGLKVVVECVETQAAYNFFKPMDVDYVQGNFLAEPVPFENILDLYKHNYQDMALT